MNKLRTVLALFLSLPMFTVAQAQNAETAADVRCIVVGMQVSKSVDTAQQASGTMVVMYYLGRLDRIVPESNLERLIVNAISQMNTRKFEAEAVRCGKSLIGKGLLLQRIGNKLSLRNQSQDEKKPISSQ